MFFAFAFAMQISRLFISILGIEENFRNSSNNINKVPNRKLCFFHKLTVIFFRQNAQRFRINKKMCR